MPGKRRRHQSVPYDDVDPEITRTKREAGEMLLRELQLMYSTHAPMTAKACCILAHWACAAGATGPVAEWALAPGNSTGNYQRLIDTLLKRRGLADVQEGTLSLPLQRRKFTPRRVTPVPARFLHESLHEEVRAVSKDELRRKMQAKEMPRAWHSHPVVQRVPPGELVIPTALYTDAAAYGGQAAGRGKSVVVISLVNLLTKTRHFGTVLRKPSQNSTRYPRSTPGTVSNAVDLR